MERNGGDDRATDFLNVFIARVKSAVMVATLATLTDGH